MVEDAKLGSIEESRLKPRPVVDTFGSGLIEQDCQDTSDIPVDRGWAWMAVLGCFGIHVFVVGGVKSLGVLIVEIRDRFEGISAKEMGLVQGIIITLMMGLGLFSNLLAARFTCRFVVCLGGLLASLGFVLTAFATQFWMVYLTYGITTGIGFGLSYTPSIVFLGSHFKKRLTLANGLSLAGSGVGSFALPNLMRVILKEYGLPGCCMLMGALMLHVCICGLLFRPHANYRTRSKITHIQNGKPMTYLSSTGNVILGDNVKDTDTDNYFNNGVDEHKLKNKLKARNCAVSEEYILLSKAHITSDQEFCNGKKNTNDIEQIIFLGKESGDPDDSAKRTFLQVSNHTSSEKTSSLSPLENSHHQNGIRKKSTRSKQTSKFDWSLLTNPVFIPYLLFALFVNVQYPNIFFMLPVHAENEGETRDKSALLMSFIGLADMTSRLGIGWFMDFKLIQRRYVLIACALMSGVFSLLMPVFKSFAGLAVYAICYGLCAGSYITLMPVVLSDLLGPEQLTSSYGLVAMAYSVALIPSPLICGQIRDSTGSWIPAFLFVGTFAVIASLFPLLQPCLQKGQKSPSIIKESVISAENEDTQV